MSVAPMRRKEPILGYVLKNDEKKNLVPIGLMLLLFRCWYFSMVAWIFLSLLRGCVQYTLQYVVHSSCLDVYWYANYVKWLVTSVRVICLEQVFFSFAAFAIDAHLKFSFVCCINVTIYHVPFYFICLLLMVIQFR